MKIVKCKDLNDSILKLQEYVDDMWHSSNRFKEEDRRKWFKAVPEDSYGDNKYRVELWVLEGSPVKGIVVVNHYRKHIYYHNYDMKKRCKFFWGEY